MIINQEGSVRGFQWMTVSGRRPRLLFRQSLTRPGRVFYQTWTGDGEWSYSHGFLDAPAWVHAALGATTDPTGLLDWLLEAVPGDDHLAAVVRDIVAAGDVVLT